MSHLRAPLALHPGDDSRLLDQTDLAIALDRMLDGELVEDLTDRQVFDAITHAQFAVDALAIELERRGRLAMIDGQVVLPYQTDVRLPSPLSRRKQ